MIRLIFTVIFLASFVFANITTDVECTRGRTVTGTETDDGLIWQQLPGTVTGHLLSSQYFTDYDQTSEVADDVQLFNGACILYVKWWGNYYNPGGTPYDPEFTIFIYGDDGEIPTPPYCSSHIAEFAIPSGTTGETYDPGLDRYYYESNVIEFQTELGIKYWFVYQCYLDFGSCGQWGIASTDEGDFWENPIYFTGDAFGYTSWQDCLNIFGYEVDIAFEFQGVIPGLESTTWGSIKTIY